MIAFFRVVWILVTYVFPWFCLCGSLALWFWLWHVARVHHWRYVEPVSGAVIALVLIIWVASVLERGRN
jgi:hypothetical protein